MLGRAVMTQDFKNMKKKDSDSKAHVVIRNHSPMSEKDRKPKERLSHDKIIANFEHFAKRDLFQKMDPILQKLFYAGGAKIINHALEEEQENLLSV